MRPGEYRWFSRVILSAHVSVAVVWWWAMGRGFGVRNVQYWVNAVLPWIVAGTILTAMQVGRIRAPVLVALAALWVSAAISGKAVFPVSFSNLWQVPLGVGAVIAGTWAIERRGGERRIRAGELAGCAAGLVIGAGLPMAFRAEQPGTHPIGAALAVFEPAAEMPAKDVFRLSKTVMIAPNASEVSMQVGDRTLEVRPLLTFQSRSPDGCWVAFATRAIREGPERQLTGSKPNGSKMSLLYRDDDRSILTIDATDATGLLRMEAMSQIPNTVWSHLNTFAELRMTGGSQLEIVFSPCADKVIEIRLADYPRGRPARFAYVDEAGSFRVMEATSAEKGPFRELASGTLGKTDPLAMEFRAGGKPLFRVVLEDWAQQASRQLSPTAGWGVAVNSIEFSLDEGGSANVFVSLAATSVGRGFDSVGHAAGVYRSRISVEWLGEN